MVWSKDQQTQQNPPPHTSPKHIAIIMDGNNRWAKKRLLSSGSGHKKGVDAIRKLLKACEKYPELTVVTLFAFSTENWLRPEDEVSGLMSLFLTYLNREVKKLVEEGIRLKVIGSKEQFSQKLQEAIKDAEFKTRDNQQRTLILCADYGGKWDIAHAAKILAERVAKGEMLASEVNESNLGKEIQLADLPPVDLCIRTGGEKRISNFLLWQNAYAELYFSDVLWPDFDDRELDAAISEFNMRQRRFGQTSQQHRG